MAARKGVAHCLELAFPISNHTAWCNDETRRPSCVRRWELAVFSPVRQILEPRDVLPSAIFIKGVSALAHDSRQKRNNLDRLPCRTGKSGTRMGHQKD